MSAKGEWKSGSETLSVAEARDDGALHWSCGEDSESEWTLETMDIGELDID